MTHAPQGSDSHEIRALTGIRGFAAILVVVFHFYGFWTVLFPFLNAFKTQVSRGPVGVDLFFVLSGFILSYVYDASNKTLDGPEFSRFVWFRLARIYPNHLFMLAVLVPLVSLAGLLHVTVTGNYSLAALPFQLTLTHAWPLAPEGADLSWNYPSWSISAEWFAYLAIFPVVAFFLHRITTPAIALLLGFAALEVWALGVSLPGLPFLVSHSHLGQVSCEFFAGGMFFSAFALRSGIVGFCQRRLSYLFVLFLIFLWVAPMPLGPFGMISMLPLLILGMTAETSLVARFFCLPPALWLGRVSYALYMSHGVAIRLTKILLPTAYFAAAPVAYRIFYVFCQLAIVFVMTTGLYYLVEVPARNYLRRVRPPWTRLFRKNERATTPLRPQE